MTFDINNLNGKAVTRLKAWGIYDVVFKGVELAKGTNKDGEVWKGMRVKFAGDSGTFEKLFFCPKEGGDQRVTGETGGRKWELPSSMEQLQCAIVHIVQMLAPEMMDKLRKALNGLNIPDDFEKLVEIVGKATAKAVNKQTKLKLIGNKQNYAEIPNFVGISKEGTVYISNNWLGDTVAFTAGEITKKEQQQNAKPTPVKDDGIDTNDTPAANDDLDFEV